MEAVSIVGHSVPMPRETVARLTETEPGKAIGTQDVGHDVASTPENNKKIQSAVQALNLFHEDRNHTRFQFKVHPEYGTLQVSLLNYLTGEVMQEVPSSKLLEFSARMREMSGLLLEKEA
ncbi:MAG: flagellar protein FlaG [Spirochaetia bacterium]|nr:flagellar protein FlaG [Spirochaetia bacterium]